MRVLGHYSRHEGNIAGKQLVSNPVHKYRVQARVTENYFVKTLGSWIAVIMGFHVSGQHVPQDWKPFYERDSFFTPFLYALNAQAVHSAALMADTTRDLRSHQFEQDRYFMAHVVFQRGMSQFLPSEITGKEDVLKNIQDADYFVL